MAAEELALTAETFHIVCTFRKEDLMRIDAKEIAGEKQIALKNLMAKLDCFTHNWNQGNCGMIVFKKTKLKGYFLK